MEIFIIIACFGGWTLFAFYHGYKEGKSYALDLLIKARIKKK